jgi:uncharacterized protein with HEPN domain
VKDEVVKDDTVYLLHIRDSARRILDYTADGREVFFKETLRQDAVIRNLEIIGEAVKNLSADFKDARNDIPWNQIAGLRAVLIHHYFGVKLETVWQVVVEHLPPLAKRVQQLLET